MKAEEREHVRHAALVDAIRHAKERDAAFANPSDTSSFRVWSTHPIEAERRFGALARSSHFEPEPLSVDEFKL